MLKFAQSAGDDQPAAKPHAWEAMPFAFHTRVPRHIMTDGDYEWQAR